MASPNQYLQQIKELGLEHMEIKASSIGEAKDTLRRIRNVQKQLRQIKRTINLDMKNIRSDYSQKTSTAASTSSAIVGLLGKRKLAGQMRADEKRRLRMERDRTLQPYESIKLTIDDLLIQMDSAKDQLQAFIEEAKLEEQSKKQATSTKRPATDVSPAGTVCPQCGAPVTESDRFCWNCTHRLQ